MIYTQQKIATMTFQKATGRADEIDLGQIDDNVVKIFNEQYPMLLGVAMQLHTWRWTDRIEAVDTTRLVDSEDARYQKKIRVPEHLKTFDGIYADDECECKLKARIRDKYIYINFANPDDPVGYIHYVSEPAEAIMPDYFAAWFVHFLALNMIMDVSGDTQRFSMLEKAEKEFMKIAKAADNKDHGRQRISTGVFVDVRN